MFRDIDAITLSIQNFTAFYAWVGLIVDEIRDLPTQVFQVGDKPFDAEIAIEWRGEKLPDEIPKQWMKTY